MPWIFLTCASAALAIAVFQIGGRTGHIHYSLALLGATCVAYWTFARRHHAAPALSLRISLPTVLLVGYTAFQIVPLPIPLVVQLSPALAELMRPVQKIAPDLRFAPLSVFPSSSLAHLVRMCGYLMMMLLVRELGWRLRSRPWAIAWPVLAAATAQAVLGLLQVGTGKPGVRAHGTQGNSDHYAAVLEMVIPIALAYGMAALRRTPRWERVGFADGLGAGTGFAAAGLMLAAVLFSLSRMGLLAALGSLVVLMGLAHASSELRIRGMRNWLLAAGAAAALFVFFAPPQLVVRLTDLSEMDPEGGGRLMNWASTLRLIQAYPVFGCGFGAFEPTFERFSRVTTQEVTHAHNDYLQCLAELGIIGSVFAGWLVIGVVSTVWRAIKAWSDHESGWMAIGIAGSLAAILIHSAGDFSLYTHADATVLSWIFGIASSTVWIGADLTDPAPVSRSAPA